MPLLLDLYISWFKMGLFTFGGGYAMLPMIQKEVIEKHHWATEDEIMNYYAIGQVTPGIIAVNTATFVGYKLKGVIGGIVATLGVISPSFIIISLISMLISNYAEIPMVQHGLAGIRIAVCVLMFDAIIKLYKKGVKNIFGIILCIGAFLLSYYTRVSMVLLVLLAGALGYAYSLMQERRKS